MSFSSVASKMSGFNHHVHHCWWCLPVYCINYRVHAFWIKGPITGPAYFFQKRQNTHQIKTDQQSIRICKNPLRDFSMLVIPLPRENECGRISVASTLCLNRPSYSGLLANKGVALILKAVLTVVGKQSYITPMLSNLPKESWNIDSDAASCMRP